MWPCYLRVWSTRSKSRRSGMPNAASPGISPRTGQRGVNLTMELIQPWPPIVVSRTNRRQLDAIGCAAASNFRNCKKACGAGRQVAKSRADSARIRSPKRSQLQSKFLSYGIGSERQDAVSSSSQLVDQVRKRLGMMTSANLYCIELSRSDVAAK